MIGLETSTLSDNSRRVVQDAEDLIKTTATYPRARLSNLLKGKKGLVTGVANGNSIAYGAARAFCPKPAADLGVLDQEADRLGDLGLLDQPAQPRVGQDILLDVFFPQHLDHRRVGEPRVDNGTVDPVEVRLLDQRRLGAFEPRLGRGVGDLAGNALRGDRADRDRRGDLLLDRQLRGQRTAVGGRRLAPTLLKCHTDSGFGARIKALPQRGAAGT